MHHKTYADKFGFTKDEVSILLQYLNQKDQLECIKDWYDGYEATKIHLYNPWAILNFFHDGNLGRHWIDTGKAYVI